MRDNKSNTWIIGASSGIGAALAQALAVEGGNLYLSARSSESLAKIKETINADGGRSNVECYPLDVVNLTEVSAAAEEIFQEAGRHRVVFMAALYDPMPIKELDLNASEKIRSESLVAKAITVFVRTSPFQRSFGYYSNSKTIDFPIATNNSIETVKAAISILESIFKNGYRYQKAGVMLTGLSNESMKKNLFSSEKDEKIKKLMRSIDNTNYRYGRST